MIKTRDLSARRERQRKSALERDLDAALAKIEVLEDLLRTERAAEQARLKWKTEDWRSVVRNGPHIER